MSSIDEQRRHAVPGRPRRRILWPTHGALNTSGPVPYPAGWPSFCFFFLTIAAPRLSINCSIKPIPCPTQLIAIFSFFFVLRLSLLIVCQRPSPELKAPIRRCSWYAGKRTTNSRDAPLIRKKKFRFFNRVNGFQQITKKAIMDMCASPLNLIRSPLRNRLVTKSC